MGAVLGMEEGMQGQTIAVVALQGSHGFRIEDFLLVLLLLLLRFPSRVGVGD
jgi:hypothetical protein